MASTESANNAPKEQAFFAEEASKQILIRIAGVLQDPDLCDASFIVEDGAEKEEIRAPSQIMAMSSPYFKSLFYPSIIGDSKEKEINGMQPKTFRKILDYLFRGRVPLSSIEDAWKVKVAGRMFQLKELEELCTKFLQYRIDSRNLIHFLKNTIKYDTPDLRDVVISRLLKDAEKAFENEQMLDLSEEELYNIMTKRPQVQGRKVMDVLMKWAKKRFAIEAPKVEKEEPVEKKIEEVKDVEMTEEKKEEEKKEEEKKEEEKKEEVKKDEEKPEEAKKDEDKKEETKMEVDSKPEEEKKDETKKEEPKAEEKKEEPKPEEKVESPKDDVVEIIEEKEKVPEEPQELDYVAKLEKFVKFINWDHTDAPYYLKEVRGKKVLSTEDQNEAMTKMLESFVAFDGKQHQVQQNVTKMQQEQIRPQSPMRQMGPKSTQQQQRGRPVQKR